MWIWLLILSFVAGVLTVLAPCVLPLLPVIIGGSVRDDKRSRAWVIIASFAVSVFVFTLALKWLTEVVGLRPEHLTMVSAVILILFGVFLLIPNIWQWISHKTKLDEGASKAQRSAGGGVGGDILLGATLGPVFNSCSPTYAILVANILPASFLWGVTNILVYILGLVIMLALVARWGRAVVNKFRRASNPNGMFKKIIAILLILVGVAIMTGVDKKAEARILENNLSIDTTLWEIDQVTSLEE